MLHDLESCTGNDKLMSESDIRRTAHTLPVLLAGADFLFSGFGSIPAYDNAFGLSNFNAEDLDDYLVHPAGLGLRGRPARLRRRRAAAAAKTGRRGVPRRLRRARASRASPTRTWLPPSSHTDRSTCPSYRRTPCRPRPSGSWSKASPSSTRCARWRAAGYELEAERVLEMLRQRLLGDFLQTSAIFDEDMRVLSNLTRSERLRRAPAPATGCRRSAAPRSHTFVRSGRPLISPRSRLAASAASICSRPGPPGRASRPTRSSWVSRPPSAWISGSP